LEAVIDMETTPFGGYAGKKNRHLYEAGSMAESQANMNEQTSPALIVALCHSGESRNPGSVAV